MKDGQINELDMDQLLKELYLEQNSEAENPAQADFVLSQDYPVTPDALKEQAFLKRLQQRPGGFGSNRIILLIIALLALIIIAVYVFSGQSPAGHERKMLQAGTREDTALRVGSTAPGVVNTLNAAKHQDTFGRPKTSGLVYVRDSMPVALEGFAQRTAIHETGLPYLTRQDELLYTRIKQQMLSALLNADKALYTHVPANKFFYAGRRITLDAFSIRNVAITNLEYKTFLADLLIQQRPADYALADVSQDGWRRAQAPSLADAYFTDKAYNDFPVVNVSMEGARLFCKWLEEESTAYISAHHLNIKPLKARLPDDVEWISAAREGYAKIAYENGYNTMYDLTEGLVDESFVSRVQLVCKRVRRIDTLYDLSATNRYGWNEKDLMSFLQGAFTYYPPVPADTLDAARMKVYGKIGRVSEIVYQKSSPRTWLAGQSWPAKQPYLELESGFRSAGSSPFVGFRPVIIYASDPAYKNPFW